MATSTFLPSSFQSFLPIAECGAPLSHNRPLDPAGEIQIGNSDAMARVRLQMRRIAPHFRSVVIHGASGTGKRTAAYALHRMSPAAEGPFITSGSGGRIGYLVKLAQHGTLYIDRIDRMPMAAQDEMLHALERTGCIGNGLGAPRRHCPRLIASTTQNLRSLVASGNFRQQLYHRIAVIQMPLPSLIDRMEDVPLLAEHYLDQTAQRHRKEAAFTEDALAWLNSYSWPGNVRELKNVIEKAALQTENGLIYAEQLASIAGECASADETAPPSSLEPARLQDVVEKHVLYVLKNCAGNKLRAAELLGISRSTLYRMLDTCSASVAGAR